MTHVSTATAIPTAPGTPFGGGFYAGRIAIDGQTYALVVAPKADGETRLPWKTEWTATAGTSSLNDGLANSEEMNDDAHPAAQFCRGLTIGGFSDWYLPSRDELEVLYRNLKPTDAENWTYDGESRLEWFGADPGEFNGVDDQGNGSNASSVPAGAAYTDADPAQTSAEAFRDGGPEAFAEGWYWSSTEFSPGFAWGQYFLDGSQYGYGKGGRLRCRAVRKVLI